MKFNNIRSYIACAALAAASFSSAASATTWNPATDFNATTNPTGAWRYGSSNSLGGAFNITSTPSNFGGADSWFGAGSSVVFHNSTNTVLHPAGTIYAAPGIIAEHPGANGQFAVIRWTAAQAGSYQVNAGFFGISEAGQQTSTDVHVLKNNISVFDGLVQGHWANENVRIGSGTLNFTLAANDTIDFVVGYGSNHNYYFDSTRLDAVITAVPEPETWGMLVLGLGLIGLAARRRKQA
jgi:hypothetical protein